MVSLDVLFVVMPNWFRQLTATRLHAETQCSTRRKGMTGGTTGALNVVSSWNAIFLGSPNKLRVPAPSRMSELHKPIGRVLLRPLNSSLLSSKMMSSCHHHHHHALHRNTTGKQQGSAANNRRHSTQKPASCTERIMLAQRQHLLQRSETATRKLNRNQQEAATRKGHLEGSTPALCCCWIA